MNNYLTNPLEFLITTLISLYILAVMLRFLLGVVRADFYNPVSQFLVRITNPLLVPLRKVIPVIGKFDTAAVVLMLVLQLVSVFIVVSLRGASVPLLQHSAVRRRRTVHAADQHLPGLRSWCRSS